MQLQLSTVAVCLGALLALFNLFGVIKPASFGQALRRFPRSTNAGYFLVLLGTVWFIWNLKQESIADFERFKPLLYALFVAVGVGTCIFVKDLIAVRGLAIVFLLLAKTMVDAGRPRLGETPWVLVIQIWAYVFVVLGIWFTISPWRMRDLLNWASADEKRIRIGSTLRMLFGIFVLILGLKVF
jgi:hypothetical protein